MMIFIFKQTILKEQNISYKRNSHHTGKSRNAGGQILLFSDEGDSIKITKGMKECKLGGWEDVKAINGILNSIRINILDQITIIYMETYDRMKSQLELKSEGLVDQIQREVFGFLKVQYTVHNIPVSKHQTIHTVFVPTLSKQQQKCENYYIGHGFGGSSLMSYMLIQPLLQKGNVIFWQIRGMGLSNKLDESYYDAIIQIEAFFLKAIQEILIFYKHNNCSFICHSFSSYLLLLFVIKFPTLARSRIKRMLLLSPIGITTKEEDYKNYIRSCSDVLHTILNKLGWAFNLTYKSPLRTICSCCKKSIIMSTIKSAQMSDAQKQMLYRIIETFIKLPDGSQTLFFKLFQPRVIPKVPLDPLFTVDPLIDIVLVFGGEADWVDKTGGRRISERFPEHIRFFNIQNPGHNIPFDYAVCMELFQKFL